MATISAMHSYGEKQESVDFQPDFSRFSEHVNRFAQPADHRSTIVDFLLTENDDIKESGGITREQLAHFVDLTYVATIFNINHLLNGCGDTFLDINLLAIAYFFILFTTRYHFDVYSIMFYSIDLVHRCLFLVFNLGVFVMTLNIKFTSLSGHHRHLTEPESDPTDEPEPVAHTSGYEAGYCVFNIPYLQGFASGYLTSRFTLIVMYSLLIYFARLHKEYDSMKTYVVKVIPLLLASVVMIALYWENVNPVKILLSVAVLEILGEILPEVVQHYLMKYKLNMFTFVISMRPSVDHLQDRLQEFFLIVLGESMIGLLINQFTVDGLRDTYIVTLFSFTLMFSLGTHFLACVHRPAEAVHAMKKKNALIRILYIWLHPVVCYVLLVATNALVQLGQQVSHSPSGMTQDSPTRLKRQVGIGLGLTVFLMVMMRTLHRGFSELLQKNGRVLHIVLKMCIVVLHVIFCWIIEDNLYFIIAESLLATSTNIVERLLPLHSSNKANLFDTPSTVDAKNLHGAQHELNTNRKSLLRPRSLQLQTMAAGLRTVSGAASSTRGAVTPASGSMTSITNADIIEPDVL